MYRAHSPSGYRSVSALAWYILMCWFCRCSGLRGHNVQEEMTALSWAANGIADCVQLLLDAGADTENPDEVRHRLLRLLLCVLECFAYARSFFHMCA